MTTMIKRHLTILTLLICTSVTGQTIVGVWTATSVRLDGSADSRQLQTKEDKVRFTFDKDGSYVKSFYVPKDMDSRPLYADFEIRDGRIEKREFLDKNGYKQKMIVVSEKVEKGEYHINVTNDTITFKSVQSHVKSGLSLETSSMLIIETVDNRPIYITLLPDKKKIGKRGSR